MDRLLCAVPIDDYIQFLLVQLVMLWFTDYRQIPDPDTLTELSVLVKVNNNKKVFQS